MVSRDEMTRERPLRGSAADVSMDSTVEEADWLLAQRGDQEAFERLYRANVDRVYGMATRMAGVQAAEELTQEVFIRVWEKLGTFRGDARFTTWLHRLAVNWILSRRETLRKREGRHVSGDEVFPTLQGRTRDPGLRLDFDGAIETLPDGAREVFVLYDVEGYSHKEIASMVGVSVGTSKSQLHRARMLLRDYLNQ